MGNLTGSPLRERLRDATVRRDTQQGAIGSRWKHDGVVAAPRAATTESRIAKDLCRSTSEMNLPEFARGEEPHPLTVWREEGRDGTIASRDACGRGLSAATPEEKSLILEHARVHDGISIR